MKIGVVTPAYNVASCIGDTIASLIAQSHSDWAMFVVDDGSTDATASVVAGFTDPRVCLARQANAGVSAARNRGIDAVGNTADAMLFLDGDDVLTPRALARLVAALEGIPGAMAAYGAYAFVSENAAVVTEIRSGPFPAGDLLQILLERNLFANGGHVLIRRAAVAAAGGFRAGIAYGEDWEYWTRIALTGPFAVVAGAEPLLVVRQRADGAYLRMAKDARMFNPCMAAMFGNPALIARFGQPKLDRIRRRTEAENAWIVGRERIRHGRSRDGLAQLRRSVIAKPGPKRLGLLALAHLLALLPEKFPAGLRGPFRRYDAPLKR